MVKKTLMIPLSYHFEQMYDYIGCNYPSNSDILWDMRTNSITHYPFKPSAPLDRWYNSTTYLKELEEFPSRMRKYEEDAKKFDEDFANGLIIKVDRYVWKENYEFEDEMYVETFGRGRSSATFTLTSKTDGRTYNVFMSDMLTICQNMTIDKGLVKGLWTFCKKGQNYGITPVIDK